MLSFSDESRFNLFNADGRIRIYRHRNERYANKCVLERNLFADRVVIVWMATNHNFKSDLELVNGNLTARQYIDQILLPIGHSNIPSTPRTHVSAQ